MTELDHYVNDERFMVFKVHGSTTWCHFFTGGSDNSREIPSPEAIVVYHAAALQPSSAFVQGQSSGPKLPNAGGLLLPAIAVPTQRKISFEFPDNHLAMLKRQLSVVTRLLIIGWRGAEEHFLELWPQHVPRDADNAAFPPKLRRTLIVTSSSDGAVKVESNLIRAARFTSGKTMYSSHGFTGLMTTARGTLEEFLAD